MQANQQRIKIGTLWQSTSDRNSHVVVCAVDSDIDSIGYFFSQPDGSSDIMTVDTMGIDDFLSAFKPQVNRYFLVCWSYESKTVSRSGHRIFMTYDGSYLNYKDFQHIMKKAYKDIRKDVIITNIVELSDDEFKDFTK